jgi:hypothetical protein
MIATQELTQTQITQQLSQIPTSESGQIIKLGRGFVTLVDRKVLENSYKLDLRTIESGSGSTAEFFVYSFQPAPLDKQDLKGLASASQLTVWLINNNGALLGAFQKLGHDSFTSYAQQDLNRLGTGASVRQLLHYTLHQMRQTVLSPNRPCDN